MSAVMEAVSAERLASLNGRDRGRSRGETPVEREYEPQPPSLPEHRVSIEGKGQEERDSHRTLKHPDELHDMSEMAARFWDNLNCDIDDSSSLELRETT